MVGVVPPCHPQDEYLGLRHNLVVVVPLASVYDLGKVQPDPGVWKQGVLMGVQPVDQLTGLVQPELLRTLSKHKQHGVYHVGLAGPIGTNHGQEALVERTNGIDARIRPEVLGDLMCHIKKSMRNPLVSDVGIA